MEFRAYASSSAGNLYSAESQGETLALECGLAIGEMRQALGFSVSRLAGCLLTHHHGDHSKGAAKLLRAGVDIYASAGTWSALGLGGHHRANVIEPLEEFQVGGFRVLPFPLRHDAEGTLGFLIGSGDGERLLFSCDTGYVPFTFKNLTIVAVECNYSAEILRASPVPPERKIRTLRNHMGLERTIEMLQANDLRKVREIHLLHLSADHGDGEAFRVAVSRATGKPTYAAPRDWRKL